MKSESQSKEHLHTHFNVCQPLPSASNPSSIISEQSVFATVNQSECQNLSYSISESSPHPPQKKKRYPVASDLQATTAVVTTASLSSNQRDFLQTATLNLMLLQRAIRASISSSNLRPTTCINNRLFRGGGGAQPHQAIGRSIQSEQLESRRRENSLYNYHSQPHYDDGHGATLPNQAASSFFAFQGTAASQPLSITPSTASEKQMLIRTENSPHSKVRTGQQNLEKLTAKMKSLLLCGSSSNSTGTPQTLHSSSLIISPSASLHRKTLTRLQLSPKMNHPCNRLSMQLEDNLRTVKSMKKLTGGATREAAAAAAVPANSIREKLTCKSLILNAAAAVHNHPLNSSVFTSPKKAITTLPAGMKLKHNSFVDYLKPSQPQHQQPPQQLCQAISQNNKLPQRDCLRNIRAKRESLSQQTGIMSAYSLGSQLNPLRQNQARNRVSQQPSSISLCASPSTSLKNNKEIAASPNEYHDNSFITAARAELIQALSTLQATAQQKEAIANQFQAITEQKQLGGGIRDNSCFVSSLLDYSKQLLTLITKKNEQSLEISSTTQQNPASPAATSLTNEKRLLRDVNRKGTSSQEGVSEAEVSQLIGGETKSISSFSQNQPPNVTPSTSSMSVTMRSLKSTFRDIQSHSHPLEFQGKARTLVRILEKIQERKASRSEQKEEEEDRIAVVSQPQLQQQLQRALDESCHERADVEVYRRNPIEDKKKLQLQGRSTLPSPPTLYGSGLLSVESGRVNNTASVSATSSQMKKPKLKLDLSILTKNRGESRILDYHDEFMSKIDEFSLSWRTAAISEASKHTLPPHQGYHPTSKYQSNGDNDGNNNDDCNGSDKSC